MRIGLVTHYMPPHMGGIERVAEGLFTGYRQHGHETRWIASRAPAEAPATEDGRMRVPCWNGPERRLGVPVPIWGAQGWRAVRELARWADALHVHDCLYPGSVAAVLARRRGGAPVLLSQHVGLVRYQRRLLNAIQRLAYATLGRWVLRRVDLLVLATAGAEAFVPTLLAPLPSSARVIANGIDTARFAPTDADGRRRARAALDVAADRPLVLFVGRLVEKKGLPLALETLRAVPEARLLVVGDGALAPLLADAGPRTSWRRAVEPAQMPLCYQAADCLLLPSQGEGLPVVVQEAMACALPVVAPADEPYVGPLAAAGVCLAAPREPAALAAGVTAALGAAGRALGARARAYACERWGAEAMTAGYLAALEGLAARRGPRP